MTANCGCYGNAPCGMFAVVTGSRGARRGVTAGTDWVVAGSLGAWVSCSDRLISKAKASAPADDKGALHHRHLGEGSLGRQQQGPRGPARLEPRRRRGLRIAEAVRVRRRQDGTGDGQGRLTFAETARPSRRPRLRRLAGSEHRAAARRHRHGRMCIERLYRTEACRARCRQHRRILGLDEKSRRDLAAVRMHDPLARRGGGLGPVGRRRHDMDDVIAAAFNSCSKR